jgi:hypothetical protein
MKPQPPTTRIFGSDTGVSKYGSTVRSGPLAKITSVRLSRKLRRTLGKGNWCSRDYVLSSSPNRNDLSVKGVSISSYSEVDEQRPGLDTREFVLDAILGFLTGFILTGDMILESKLYMSLYFVAHLLGSRSRNLSSDFG